jgi:hypothetical protein
MRQYRQMRLGVFPPLLHTRDRLSGSWLCAELDPTVEAVFRNYSEGQLIGAKESSFFNGCCFHHPIISLGSIKFILGFYLFITCTVPCVTHEIVFSQASRAHWVRYHFAWDGYSGAAWPAIHIDSMWIEKAAPTLRFTIGPHSFARFFRQILVVRSPDFWDNAFDRAKSLACRARTRWGDESSGLTLVTNKKIIIGQTLISPESRDGGQYPWLNCYIIELAW